MIDARRVARVVLLMLALLLVGPVMDAGAVGPVVSPATCAITWTAPSTNVDGTPLVDLARYEVQVGSAPGTFSSPAVAVPVVAPAPVPGSSVTWLCVGVTDGQRYARVRAVDLAGNPSAWTAEVPFLFDAVAPAAPTGVRVGP